MPATITTADRGDTRSATPFAPVAQHPLSFTVGHSTEPSLARHKGEIPKGQKPSRGAGKLLRYMKRKGAEGSRSVRDVSERLQQGLTNTVVNTVCDALFVANTIGTKVHPAVKPASGAANPPDSLIAPFTPGLLKSQLGPFKKQVAIQKKELKKAAATLDQAFSKLDGLEQAAAVHRQSAYAALCKHKDLVVQLHKLHRQLQKESQQQGNAPSPGLATTTRLAVGSAATKVCDELMKRFGQNPQTPAEIAGDTLDCLWSIAHDIVQADLVTAELARIREDMGAAEYAPQVVQQARALKNLAKQSKHDPAVLDAMQSGVAALEEHVHRVADMLEKKNSLLDELADPGTDPRKGSLPALPGLPKPQPSDIMKVINDWACQTLQESSEDEVDVTRRALKPLGAVSVKLNQNHSLTRAPAMVALRNAVESERVRRYQTAPLKVLAQLVLKIQDRGDDSLSSGQNADAIELSDDRVLDRRLCHEAKCALANLLRGLCESPSATRSRTEQLAALLNAADNNVACKVLSENRLWTEPRIFDDMLARILETATDAQVMGPQYRRLMQEIRVIVTRSALGGNDEKRAAELAGQLDFDGLGEALPSRSKPSIARRAWRKLGFWTHYLILKKEGEAEKLRLDYHQRHTEDALGGLLKVMSRDGASPKQVQDAYRYFLEIADGLRVELGLQEYPDSKWDEVLQRLVSRKVGEFGPHSVRNMYRQLGSDCPDVLAKPSRFAFLRPVRSWWRNAFHDAERAASLSAPPLTGTGEKVWSTLRRTVEREPDARVYAGLLVELAGKFGRVHNKDYAGMKDVLDAIIRRDAESWISPRAGTFSSYDAAWDRVEDALATRLIDRLERYAERMEDFLKLDGQANTIAPDNLYFYRYILEGLWDSGEAARARRNLKADVAPPQLAAAPALAAAQ